MFGAFWSVNDGLAGSYGTIPPVTYTSTTGLLGVTQLTLGWGLDIEMAGIWARQVADGQIHKYIQAHLHHTIITNIPIAAQVANRANIFLFVRGENARRATTMMEILEVLEVLHGKKLGI